MKEITKVRRRKWGKTERKETRKMMRKRGEEWREGRKESVQEDQARTEPLTWTSCSRECQWWVDGGGTSPSLLGSSFLLLLTLQSRLLTFRPAAVDRRPAELSTLNDGYQIRIWPVDLTPDSLTRQEPRPGFVVHVVQFLSGPDVVLSPRPPDKHRRPTRDKWVLKNQRSSLRQMTSPSLHHHTVTSSQWRHHSVTSSLCDIITQWHHHSVTSSLCDLFLQLL